MVNPILTSHLFIHFYFYVYYLYFRYKCWLVHILYENHFFRASCSNIKNGNGLLCHCPESNGPFPSYATVGGRDSQNSPIFYYDNSVRFLQTIRLSNKSIHYLAVISLFSRDHFHHTKS